MQKFDIEKEELDCVEERIGKLEQLCSEIHAFISSMNATIEILVARTA